MIGGGGGAGSAIDTNIKGEPASIRAVSAWLRGDVRSAADDFGDTVHAQRSRIRSAWIGEAGDGLARQVGITGSMSDGVSANATRAAAAVDALATGLATAKDEMADVRAAAAAEGLSVSGTMISLPGSPPPDVPDLPAGATEVEAATHRERVAAVDDWNSKVAAFAHFSEIVRLAKRVWSDLCSAHVADWTEQRSNIVGLFTDGIGAGVESVMVTKYGNAYRVEASQLMRKAADFEDMVARMPRGAFPGSLAANATPMQVAIHEARLSGLQNPRLALELTERAAANRVEAAALREMAKKGRMPADVTRGVKGAGHALSVAGAAYGVYADIQDGESVGQAVVSNGVGLGASIAVGAALGTAIPVPVVGTVVGALGGAAVGIFTSGMVDSLWDSGVDGIGDVGESLVDGGKELVETGKAIGDLAGDAGEAIGDGAKKVWDSIF